MTKHESAAVIQSGGQQPLAVMENYLPEDLIPLGESDRTRHGLYQLM